MVGKAKIAPEHLTIDHQPRSGTWLVQPRPDSLVRSIGYPSSERLLELASLAGMKDVYFHHEPMRPQGTKFMLYIGRGSTPKQRKQFLATLEAESEVSLRKFTEQDLAKATWLLRQSPLYEVSVAGERGFAPMSQAAGLLNHVFVPGQPVGDLVLELIGQKLTLRTITEEEKVQINQLADEISDSK